jgi:hypothetical protein
MIDTPKQGLQTMNDLPPKQETPGTDGIHVQGIIVAGEFCKCELIVRCKYALGHCFSDL